MPSQRGPAANIASQKTGFTLMEILVSAMILVTIVYGLINIFLASKGRSMHSRSVITSAELGRYFLEPLQLQVRQDWWNELPALDAANFIIWPGNYRSHDLPDIFGQYKGYTPLWFEEPHPGGIIKYYPVYEVSGVAGLRKVRFILCWQEPTF